jgi:acetyl esterase/lipase
MKKATGVMLATLLAFAAGLGSLAAQTPAPAPTDVALPHGEVQLLWPTGAPGAVGATDEDKPRLEVFGAAGATPHTAVIVCPGGGYTHLAYEKEGTRIAEWLNTQGISAFVLTYRLAPRYKQPAPFEDGKRAVRWVRAHAADYHVDPNRIGMWGFSAGGHLVGMVGTHFDAGNPQATDLIDRSSSRPDFVISAYGLLALDGEAARKESLSSFTDRPVTPELIRELSPASSVTAHTPPFFIFATTDDARVPVLSSVAFYAAMQRAGVPVEMHLYEHGPHGVGLAMPFPELSTWTGLLENWLKFHGWIDPPMKY